MRTTTDYHLIALTFAQTLVAGEYDAAYNMLGSSLRHTLTARDLKNMYEAMIGYFDESPTNVEVITVLDEWPDKAANDCGWTYVAIEGLGEAEAVMVVVSHEGTRLVIRDIEWGRP